MKFYIEGTTENTGSLLPGRTVEICRDCDGVNYNVPIDRVSLCAHCGREMFPCSACKTGSCSWDAFHLKCDKFSHSHKYRRYVQERRLLSEKGLFEELKILTEKESEERRYHVLENEIIEGTDESDVETFEDDCEWSEADVEPETPDKWFDDGFDSETLRAPKKELRVTGSINRDDYENGRKAGLACLTEIQRAIDKQK